MKHEIKYLHSYNLQTNHLINRLNKIIVNPTYQFYCYVSVILLEVDLTILEKQKPALFDWSLTYLYKDHTHIFRSILILDVIIFISN